MEVSVIAFEATKVAVLEHRGPPELLNESVLRFIAWRQSSQLSPVKTSKTFGIAYNDPERAEPSAFRFDICGSVTEDVPPNPQGVITKTKR
jgi:AraC family transcriptional regulator